jgi:amino acid permease
MIREKEKKQVELLGPIATGFTLFKGFVCTGILYMPLSFVNGGWLFSVIALVLALLLTLYCIRLILEVRGKLGGNLSFSDIGMATYGKTGKWLVDISLFGS